MVVDVLNVLDTLLTDNWVPGNTDSLTPAIGPIFDYNTIDLNENDYILLYEVVRSPYKNATGSATKGYKDAVSIDIRTNDSRKHFIKVITEVERILDANITSPGTGYDILDPEGSDQTDLSDKRRNIWRMVWTVRFKNTNVTR